MVRGMKLRLLFLLLTPVLAVGCTIIPASDAPPPRDSPAYAPPGPPAPVQQGPIPGDPPLSPPDESLAYAMLGQTVRVDGPSVTPLAVVEDSRCPMNARCVWAGQVRLKLRIGSGRGETLEITSGKPIHVADGQLELVEVLPDKVAGGSNGGVIEASAYRFGFRFRGGY